MGWIRDGIGNSKAHLSYAMHYDVDFNLIQNGTRENKLKTLSVDLIERSALALY